MTPDTASFARILRDVRAGDPAGTAALSEHFSAGASFLLMRSAGPARASELVKEVLRACALAILDGEPADPVRLPGLVRTIAWQVLDRALANPSQAREPPSLAGRREISLRTMGAADAILKPMTDGNREALCRLYLDKDLPERICSELNLSAEQFQRLRAGARQKFALEESRSMPFAARLLKQVR